MDKEWVIRLSYLDDIFTRLNLLNKSLQGRFTTVVEFIDKIRAFIMKLNLWEGNARDGNLDIFENLTAAVGSERPDAENIRLVKAHLSCLREEFQSYFPDLSEMNVTLIRNPFIVEVRSLPDEVQEEFVKFVNDSTAKDAFDTLPLINFWSKMSAYYPSVCTIVVSGLLMFPSTYLCEQGFSALFFIKNRFRSRLSVEPDLRIALSKTEPRIEARWKLSKHSPPIESQETFCNVLKNFSIF